MFAHIVRVIYKSCSWFKTTGSIFSILPTARTRQIPYKGYCNLPLKCIIDQCIIIAFRFKENVIIKKREWINTCFSVPVDFLCVSLKTKIIKPVKRNSYPLKFSILALLKKKLEFKITNKNEHKCCFKTVILIFSEVQCFKILYIFWVMEKGLNQNFKQEFNPSEQVFKKISLLYFS